MKDGTKELKIYNTLKDNLEFDTDILTILKILNKLLEIDTSKAITCWLELLNKYPIKELLSDTDFLPLIKDFSYNLIKTIKLDNYLKIRESLNKDNQFLIDNYVLNIYTTSTLNVLLDELITTSKITEEKAIIDILNKNSSTLPKEFFDFSEFLKTIVMKHIKLNQINKELFEDMLKLAKNTKDKAILEAWLIDYL